jgi:hypothetical protein
MANRATSRSIGSSWDVGRRPTVNRKRTPATVITMGAIERAITIRASVGATLMVCSWTVLSSRAALEREVVLDGDHRYQINGEESRTLAATSAFRVVTERDRRDPRDGSLDTRDDSLRHTERDNPQPPAHVETLELGHWYGHLSLGQRRLRLSLTTLQPAAHPRS